MVKIIGIDVHIKPKDCPEIAENCEKAVLKMQGRLEQSSVVPFEREQDQSRPALKRFRFRIVHRGKDENEMDENRDVG